MYEITFEEALGGRLHYWVWARRKGVFGLDRLVCSDAFELPSEVATGECVCVGGFAGKVRVSCVSVKAVLGGDERALGLGRGLEIWRLLRDTDRQELVFYLECFFQLLV